MKRNKPIDTGRAWQPQIVTAPAIEFIALPEEPREQNPSTNPIVTYDRYSNPTVDAVVSAGQRYQKSVEKYSRALSSGKGAEAARKDMVAAEKSFKSSLGPSPLLTSAVAALFAAIGAKIGGTPGAAVGALVGGAIPVFLFSPTPSIEVPEAEEEEEKPERRPAMAGRRPNPIIVGATDAIAPRAPNKRRRKKNRSKGAPRRSRRVNNLRKEVDDF
jgi:hypothetical protein